MITVQQEISVHGLSSALHVGGPILKGVGDAICGLQCISFITRLMSLVRIITKQKKAKQKNAAPAVG
jgi:hypothetical protein